MKNIVNTFANQTVGFTKATEIPFTTQRINNNFTENFTTMLVTEKNSFVDVGQNITTNIIEMDGNSNSSVLSTTLSVIESQNTTLFSEETTTFNILNNQNNSIFEETTTFDVFNNQNSSIIEETTTFNILNGQNSSIIEETTSNFIEETSKSITEAFNASQEAITNTLTPTEDYDGLNFHHEGSPVLLLAVMGVILALLVVVVISLIFVYNRYKQDNGIRSRSGEYCVQQMSLSNSDSVCTKTPTMEILQERL